MIAAVLDSLESLNSGFSTQGVRMKVHLPNSDSAGTQSSNGSTTDTHDNSPALTAVPTQQETVPKIKPKPKLKLKKPVAKSKLKLKDPTLAPKPKKEESNATESKVKLHTARYPWDDWFARGRFRLYRGKHFTCQMHGMMRNIQEAAKRHDLKASIHFMEDHLLVEVKPHE